jgi:hypothetical protein
MKLTAVKSTLCGVLLFGSIAQASAQSADAINVVTTAVPFLRISPDARAGGMGDMGIATSPDANSGFWNIGKVAFNQSKAGAGITYTPWLKDLGLNDVYLLSAAGYAKLDDLSAISGSIRYFSLGNIQFTDNLGNDLNTFRPREFGVDFGYSRKLSDKMGVGVGLKFISSNLASGSVGGTTYKTGTTVAGDLGFYYNGANELGQGWSFGAAMSNLGGKIGYTDNATQRDYIPANLGLGTTYTRVFNEQNKVSFGLDINKLMVPTPPADPATQAQLDKYRSKGVLGSWFSSFGDAPGGFGEEIKEFQASLGAEYTYNNQFSLRAGYFNESKTKGNRKYFTMGVGVKYNVFGLNFAYLLPSGNGVNRNPLSNTLRFSLIFDLDGGDNTKE